LSGPVEGSSEEEVVVSEDGKSDNGRNEERGRTDREVPVSDEKSGWRFSMPTLAGNTETQQFRLRARRAPV